MADSPRPPTPPESDLSSLLGGAPCQVVGRGRMGSALAASLTRSGVNVQGPLARGADGAGASIVLLCVPDREIANAAGAITSDAIVAHVSASSDLSMLAPHECASMHPLLSVSDASADFGGAACAVDGSTTRALALVEAIAVRLGMRPVRVAGDRRAVYHAAASAAANFTTTVLGAAERLAAEAGIDRDALRPLVESSLRNWERLGARDALTGPIARGDEATAARQRGSVAERAPDLLPLWDALADGTRALAATRSPPPPAPRDAP